MGSLLLLSYSATNIQMFVLLPPWHCGLNHSSNYLGHCACRTKLMPLFAIFAGEGPLPPEGGPAEIPQSMEQMNSEANLQAQVLNCLLDLLLII